MDKIDLMKRFQLNPELLVNFLPFTISFSNDSQIYENNVDLANFLGYNETDPERLYFLYSAEEIYKNSLIITILYYIVVKLVQFLFYLGRKKCKIVEKMHTFLKYQSRWWTIIASFVEANGVMIGFCCVLQIKLLTGNDFLDKVNSVFMLLMLFGIIFYGSSFCLLVKNYQKKKYAKVLLTYTKITKKSFLFEPFIILVRSLIKSVIHSFFL